MTHQEYSMGGICPGWIGLGLSFGCKNDSCCEFQWITLLTHLILHHFSAEKQPTLYRALQALEELQSMWEVKVTDLRYELYHSANNDGLAKLFKYYSKFDSKPAYVLTLGKLFLFLHMYWHIHHFSSAPSIFQDAIYPESMGRCWGTSCRTCSW